MLGWLPSTAQIVNSQPVRESRLSKSLVQPIRTLSGKVLGTELDALLAVSNVQEIIWRLQEEGAVERAAELQALLLHRLEHSAVRDMRVINGGYSEALLIELDDGLRAVFKTVDNYYHTFRRELLLYRFDQLIGTHIVPMTITRTIAGKTGSLQLFIENSWSADDIIQAKRRQLGLPEGYIYSHRLFIHALAPPSSPAVKTLRLLSLEGDENFGNYLLPLVGRQVAIDGGRTFLASREQVKQRTADLRAKPLTYYLDTQLVANIKMNKDAIEEIFLANSHIYQQVLDLGEFNNRQELVEEFGDLGNLSTEHLRITFRAYQEIATNQPPATNINEKTIEQVLVEDLAEKNWQEADQIIAIHPHLLYHEIANILNVAKKTKRLAIDALDARTR